MGARGIGEVAAGAKLHSRIPTRLYGDLLAGSGTERVDRARLRPDLPTAVRAGGEGTRRFKRGRCGACGEELVLYTNRTIAGGV